MDARAEPGQQCDAAERGDQQALYYRPGQFLAVTGAVQRQFAVPQVVGQLCSDAEASGQLAQIGLGARIFGDQCAYV